MSRDDLLERLLASARSERPGFNLLLTDSGQVFAASDGGLGGAEGWECDSGLSALVVSLLAKGELEVAHSCRMTAVVIRFETIDGRERGIETDQLVTGRVLRIGRHLAVETARENVLRYELVGRPANRRR